MGARKSFGQFACESVANPRNLTDRGPRCNGTATGLTQRRRGAESSRGGKFRGSVARPGTGWEGRVADRVGVACLDGVADQPKAGLEVGERGGDAGTVVQEDVGPEGGRAGGQPRDVAPAGAQVGAPEAPRREGGGE